MEMRNVVAYVRVSTDGQVGEDKFGIEAQKEQILKYCHENDMQISDWYVDEGESGVKESRPALDRLLFGEIKNPPVTAVIVSKSDRMARDIKLYYYYMMILEKKGIELISATEPVVNDETGLGNVYKSLMLFVAEQERKNITARTSAGRQVKASKGGYSGGRAPMGYRVEKGRLVIEPTEVAVVKRIHELRDGGASMPKIVETINDEGYRGRKGNKFALSTVQGIINNRKTYEGFYKYGEKGEWVKGDHEAILEG